MNEQIKQIAERLRGLRDVLEPVSYTHLDVYKRQTLPWKSP